MSDFKVPIKNVLYMYSYIWDKVDKDDITKINANDDFTSIDIYAELFLMNVNKIIKKGLYKQYNETNEEIKSIKGKIDFKLSINNLSFRNAKAFCTYDELENNNIYNQIIKSTAIKIYKTSNLAVKLKSKVNDVLLYFNQVNFFEIKKKDFINLRFNKNNLHYYYILKICELINDNLMLSNDDGNYEFKNLFDDEKNMHNIFELFINKFYKYELENSYSVYYQKELKWDIQDGDISLLPIMKLDTTIVSKNETIILDTKYYKEYFNVNDYGSKKFKSDHLYQIVSYMNNIRCTNTLRGILLYPMPYTTDEVKESYSVNVLSENKVIKATIEIYTIDLSNEWKYIKENLLKIIHTGHTNNF